jgi:hypothetical protein
MARAGEPGLDGEWRVERVSGLLPPRPQLRKRIRGVEGATHVGPLRLRFAVRPHGHQLVELVYGVPLLVDRVRERGDGSWDGEAFLAGVPYCRFRLVRSA